MRIGKRAAKLLDRFRQMQVGDVITKEELTQILGKSFDSDRSPYYTANNRLRKEAGRHLAPIRNVGYTMVPATDHLELAEDRRRSAGRKMTQAIGLIEAAQKHPEELTKELLGKCNFLLGSYNQVNASIRSITRDVKRHQEQIENLASQSVIHSARANKQDDRIANIEKQMQALVESLGLNRAA